MIRVLLADDHTILRDGMRALLSQEADMEVVGGVNNGQELLDLLATTPTDVVLMDINMPVLDGFAAMPLLQERFPQVRVLVLSMLDNEHYVHRMMQAGAAGYVLKSAEGIEIVYGIRAVAAGQMFLCTELSLMIMQRLIERSASTCIPVAERKTGELSAREMEILQLLAQGLTNAEIAEKLFTSKRTVETHRQNIIEKTKVRNTAALIRYAISQGLIQ